MAHFNADAARKRLPPVAWEPITFEIGGEEFKALNEPTFGDVLDLADAPEVTMETEEQAILALAHFIELLVPEGDRLRFRTALKMIPASQSTVVIELGTWLVEQVTGNPTKPPATSRRGRRTSGGTSRPNSAGRTRSS